MKKICVTLAFLVTMVTGVAAETAKVVFAGDGITDGAWGRTKGAAKATAERNQSNQNHHLGDSYVFMCAAWYQSQYPTAGINIVNRGIVGNTLDDLSVRWKADVLDQNPSMISVLIGAKDIDNYISTGTSEAFDFDVWQTKYRSLLQQARTANANVKLVLGAPFAGSKAANYAQRKELLAVCAARVEALAAEFGAVYVPFDELFATEPSEGSFLWDGMLPTPAGHYQMFRMWVDKVGNSIFASSVTQQTIGPAASQTVNGKRRVLYIGDSITDAGWGLSGGSALNTNQRNLTALDHILGHGYAMLCGAWFQANCPEANYEVLNRGISGNTLANLAARWQADALDLNPDVISILIGTNDVDVWLKGTQTTAFDYDGWESQYRSLLAQLTAQNPHVEIVLCAPFLGSRASNYDTRKAMVAALAARVKAIANDLGCTYVAFDELFATLTQNQPNTAYWIWDGIHPSPAGHYKMFELWMKEAGGLLFAEQQTTVVDPSKTGRQFMDLLLPMEGSVAATAADWGTTAGENTNPKYAGTWDGTLGRWKDNGVEDTERSYWGGNIVKGSDGKYHMYVAGWPSATKGHMAWSSASRVYHVISDNVWGPYVYVSDIGPGHNPEVYKTGDTYVIYHIEKLGYYKSKTLGDTWETGTYDFDLRGRAIVAGESRETSLSNCSFAKREDGSFVMIDRGGGIWVSRDGLEDSWHHLTNASVYLNSKIKTRGSLEDPVIWHDHLQYHMIVNDWKARYAYYYRSLDGLHWVMEDGKAYTGQDPFAQHADGTVEKWHKYERPRIYQDELGRAIRMNFAVIDCVKQSDLAGDDHSSKNINMPVTKQLLLEVQGTEPVTASTTSISVLVKAEADFNPRTDLDLSTLKFGSHDKINAGGGFSYSSSTNSGTSDLIVTFTGTAGASGITDGEWAPKMLGRKTDGSIAFGYAKMPGVNYQPSLLSAVRPSPSPDGSTISIAITNYGLSASAQGTVRIFDPNNTLLGQASIAPIAPYETVTATMATKATVKTGLSKFIIVYYANSKELYREEISNDELSAYWTSLQNEITAARELLANTNLTIGRAELQAAVDDAQQYLTSYSIADIEAAKNRLIQAANAFKVANASPTSGVSITIQNASMDAIAPWVVLHNDANDTPGFKINANGANYGFTGNFMETWVNPANALGRSNYAYQELENMPAGRYRMKAQAIACRQSGGSGAALQGVTLFLNDETTALSTESGKAESFQVILWLKEEGKLKLGLNIDAETNANWVAWDSVVLEYFGTEEGEIVEPVEPDNRLRFDETTSYYFKNASSTAKYVYVQRPSQNVSGDNVVHRTDNKSNAAELAIVADTEAGRFYVKDVETGLYFTPDATNANGGNWTFGETPTVTVISDNTASVASSWNLTGDAAKVYVLSNGQNMYANAYRAASGNTVQSYRAADQGSQWYIIPTGKAVTTAIRQPSTHGTPSSSPAFFTLSGTRISRPQHGVFIEYKPGVGMRKVIIK